MRIAVDAMGGDYAPGIAVEGVVIALHDFPDYEIVLVGHSGKLAFYLEKYGISGHPRLKVVHADSVVEMREPSSAALRAKRNSSMTVCAKLLKTHEVDAVVSAGHTGAAVASTTVLVRTLPGVDRPAIAANMPAQGGRFILVDGGANTDCEPFHLIQFAVMGSIYAEFVYGEPRPRIGLLSVGGEDIKGNKLTKGVFPALEKMEELNFVGNVEADAIFERAADVLICDGFTGNVFLKCSEGLAKSTIFWLKTVFMKNVIRKTSAMFSRNAFRELKSFGDAEELGGAPLLGINGICIIGHGSSTPKSIRNAVRVAGECVKFKLNEKIVDLMARTHSTTKELSEPPEGAAKEH